MIIQKTKVKKMFNQQKLQITDDALNQINDYVFRVLYNKTVKAKEGNIKRVTPELLHLIGIHGG